MTEILADPVLTGRYQLERDSFTAAHARTPLSPRRATR